MTDAELRLRIAENLAAVERRIRAACSRAGRSRESVTLVGVTKYVTVSMVSMLHELGVRDLGESRPQELWKKAAAMPSSVRWHLIGHLQRNKAERTLPLVSLIHSVDSIRLLEALEKEAIRQDRDVNVLVEINLSGEAAKTGLPPEQWPGLRSYAQGLAKVRIGGLMTMAALQDPEQCRPTFARLRQMAGQNAMLSMGMSNDFEVAIEEGATHIRLGSVLFEGIPDAIHET
jgi:pyridoxal phosphate enzyme (YggS family)